MKLVFGVLAVFALGACKSMGGMGGESATSSHQFENWENGEPSDHNHKENCVLAKPGGGWADYDCNKLKMFACRKKNNPEVWDIDGREGIFADWKNRCDPGYVFAAPRDADEALALSNRMHDNSVWINLTDEEEEDYFQPAGHGHGGHHGDDDDDDDDDDNNQGGRQTFFNWDNNQPTNDSDDACVMMRPGGKWASIPCDAERFVACQKNNNPSKWDIVGTRFTFEAAGDSCNQGFSFAAPQDAQENLDLSNRMFNDSVWIGVRKRNGKWYHQ
ncbi:MAG: lectin-like protein [Oligoflexales bacterium]